tara:strand:- start:226 stop:732 length:507 start_codon:yes stop_codon:yes gene_type:complete
MTKTIITFLFILGILTLGRIIPHPPNFTPILATAIYTPYMVNNKWLAMLIPLSAMFIADIIIGFHPYMLWVYGAIGLSTLISSWSMRFNKKYIQLGVMAILSSILFFIITNFGVWTIWDYYPKTINGLLLCYTMAIPFFQNTLLGTMIYTAIIILTIKKGEKYANNYF